MDLWRFPSFLTFFGRPLSYSQNAITMYSTEDADIQPPFPLYYLSCIQTGYNIGWPFIQTYKLGSCHSFSVRGTVDVLHKTECDLMRQRGEDCSECHDSWDDNVEKDWSTVWERISARPVAVRDELRRQWEAQCQQKCGPVNGMKLFLWWQKWLWIIMLWIRYNSWIMIIKKYNNK